MLTFFKDFAAALDELRRHATLFLLVIALGAIALLGRSWLDARDARIQLAATLAAQQKTIAAANQDQSARDAQLAQSLAQIAALKQKVQTPTQAAAALVQAIPRLVASEGNSQPLPSPITIQMPTQTQSPAQTKLGSAAAGNQPLSSISAAAQTLPPQSASTASSPSSTLEVLSALKSQIADLQSSPDSQSSSSTNTPQPANATRSSPTVLKSEISIVKSPSGAQSSAVPQSSSSAASSSGAVPASPPPANAAGGAAPPAILRIPQNDLKPLYDAVEDCEACATKLTAAQADLKDETTKFNAASAERDAAVRAVHGTFWTRVRTAAKWLAIGAAAGAVLAHYH
jgi:hypothetical protein